MWRDHDSFKFSFKFNYFHHGLKCTRKVPVTLFNALLSYSVGWSGGGRALESEAAGVHSSSHRTVQHGSIWSVGAFSALCSVLPFSISA